MISNSHPITCGDRLTIFNFLAQIKSCASLLLEFCSYYWCVFSVSSSWIACCWVLKTFSGVDSVGTVSASLVTYASVQALQPDLIINAGTAGGFKVSSACPYLFPYSFNHFLNRIYLVAFQFCLIADSVLFSWLRNCLVAFLF